MNMVLDFLSSVKFGVVLLCILVILSMTGMIIIQQNVSGFDAYYAGLTPAQKTVYGGLGLFDIYHSWYFNFLLLVLSLNIVLASIDRFPSAWSYIVNPKLSATLNFIRSRPSDASILLKSDSAEKTAEEVATAMKHRGLKPTITEKNGVY
ncbi:MAG: cytochrome c biogenesis protein ResB, partial [Acidobacteriota bacterium]|nr:cytochrome c biogenesis protein ResB [Acidobacteriota bacterium]